ncbi:hypothetical protein ACGFYZ_22100 [Streptomyces sp. NPDC048330]|uniref:hypothetical protein n=1 Tax=Streptomyces sp. NPDC048330 TaxID=3365533 RepID=UPI0037223F73
MTRLLRRAANTRSAEPVTDGGGAAERPEEPAAATTKGEADAAAETPVEGESAVADGDDDVDAVAVDGPEVSAAVAARPFAVTWRRAALAAAVAVLLLAGSAFFHGAHRLRSTPAARNTALTDAGATARVGGDVGEGLARIFSYTPTSDDAVERSAGTVLAGRAARQYTDLFAQVRAQLVEQRITLSTQTVRTGVIELAGDSARLLVFLDQTSRRDDARQGRATVTSAAAQLTVTATFRGDRWLIVDIKAR